MKKIESYVARLTLTHTLIYTFIHTHADTYMHTLCTHAHILMQTKTLTYTHAHTCAHTCTYSCIHTKTHTYTHMQTDMGAHRCVSIHTHTFQKSKYLNLVFFLTFMSHIKPDYISVTHRITQQSQ